MASRSIEAGGALVGAVGAVCALGYDATTAFAAARAQLSRATVQPHFRIRSGVEGVEEPVVGHAASLLTSGFEGEARLLRLAQGALSDLLAACARVAVPWQGAAFYLAGSRRGAAPGGAPDHDATRRLLDRAAAASGWPARPELRFASHEGHTAGARALAAAARDLHEGKAAAAVVLAIDSLLDEQTLQDLAESDRLKCDAMPSGLQPGEAAVALLLLPSQSVLDAPALRLMAAAIDEEPSSPPAEWICTGEALSRALLQAWSHAPSPTVWLLSDHNGEHGRAYEWGGALSRLRAAGDAFAAPETSFPALGFGDTGAASALLAVGMVWHHGGRGAAPSPAALVASSSDANTRAALLLQQA